ncbi:MAG TPA: hypothetical protein VGH28_10945 [Polyangiaceae bacterium]
MKRTTALLVILFTAACSGGQSGWGDDSNGDDASSVDDGSPSGSDGATQGQDSGGTTKDSGGGTTDSGGTKDAGTPQDSGGIVADSGDGFGAVRTACINEINKLRQQFGHKAYSLWETGPIDTCVDEQATYDQNAGIAHDAWQHNKYPTCNGNAQDECEGYGNTVQGITQCMDDMWNERNQPNCASCDSCNSTQLTQQVINCESTKTCDFYGNYGSECGHYLNMSADYFAEAACGFSTVGSKQDWAVQNFQ